MKVLSIVRKYHLPFISAIVSGIICFLLMTAFFCRSYAVSILKNQFEELEKNLQSVGYDFAYDDLTFHTFSPWQIMRAKNFRIYSLDDKDFWQWTAEELSIDVGLWNIDTANLFLGTKQRLQHSGKEWKIELPQSEVIVRLKKGKIKELAFALTDIKVNNLMTIDSFSAQIKQQTIPQISLKADVKGLVLDDMTGWPLNKLVDHMYLYASLQGSWDKDLPLSEAFYEWIDDGGFVGIHKMILNWKPLIMVANGDIGFDNDSAATLSLNTASLALEETLDKLNENGYLSNKGVFVAKLLLQKKAIQQNAADQYKTVVTPLKISRDEVLLENIKIK